jgi:hypothetical protein
LENIICYYGHLSHFRAGPGPCFRADQYHFPATMFANSRLYTINQFQHFNHQQAGWLLIGIQLQKPLNSHRQQYNPPTEYLFLVQKRKRKLGKDSQLLIISKEELEKLYQSNPNYERAGRLIAEYLFANWESKLRDTIFLSPTERYKNLIKTRPGVLQRVPQYHIASYLNITPQYLSQIRKKIISETS